MNDLLKDHLEINIGNEASSPDWNHPSALIDWRMMIGDFARANWAGFPPALQNGLKSDAEYTVTKMTFYMALATAKKMEFQQGMEEDTGLNPSPAPTTFNM